SSDRQRERFLRAASKSTEHQSSRRFRLWGLVALVIAMTTIVQASRLIAPMSSKRKNTADVENEALRRARIHRMSVDFALSEVFDGWRRGKEWTDAARR
ncbi:MAG: hypothetical protein AAGJ83_02125, partial [Planctomycetota bacterium]